MMTEKELIKHLEYSEFWWAKEDGDIYIRWPKYPDEKVKVDLSALPDLSWSEVRRYVTDGRDVHHMTRVVGYYSRIENWNKSKLGELKGREAGEYSVQAAHK